MEARVRYCECGKAWKVEKLSGGRLRGIKHIGGECKLDWEALAGDTRLPKATPVEPPG